jgi:hypothetical protein
MNLGHFTGRPARLTIRILHILTLLLLFIFFLLYHVEEAILKLLREQYRCVALQHRVIHVAYLPHRVDDPRVAQREQTVISTGQ